MWDRGARCQQVVLHARYRWPHSLNYVFLRWLIYFIYSFVYLSMDDFLLIWWFVYLFTLLYWLELKQDQSFMLWNFDDSFLAVHFLPHGFCIPQLSTEPEAFHVRKKRKIYAMFIYDLFHTVLELPFLGLYPMVFCAYVLASVMILKKPLHNARRQMNNMHAAKTIKWSKSILSSSHAKVQ